MVRSLCAVVRFFFETYQPCILLLTSPFFIISHTPMQRLYWGDVLLRNWLCSPYALGPYRPGDGWGRPSQLAVDDVLGHPLYQHAVTAYHHGPGPCRARGARAPPPGPHGDAQDGAVARTRWVLRMAVAGMLRYGAKNFIRPHIPLCVKFDLPCR